VKFGDSDDPVLDELYEMNTQTSSQWDGFHHFGHLASGLFYNGCTLVSPIPSFGCFPHTLHPPRL